MRGVLKYATENGQLDVKIDDRTSTIALQGRQLIGMIVVKELFAHEYQDCSVSLLTLVREMQIPSLMLDYSTLHELTFRVHDEAEFVNGIFKVVQVALENNEYPKLVWNDVPRRK